MIVQITGPNPHLL